MSRDKIIASRQRPVLNPLRQGESTARRPLRVRFERGRVLLGMRSQGWQICVVGGLLATACMHLPANQPRNLVGSFETVDPPPAPHRDGIGSGERQRRDDVVVPPQIPTIGNVSPTYPAAAASVLGAPRVAIVKVTFETNGRISDVEPSLRSPLLLDGVGREVFAAIKAAVLQWHIEPARVIHYRRSETGERTYVGSEPLPGTMELKFTFGAARDDSSS